MFCGFIPQEDHDGDHQVVVLDFLMPMPMQDLFLDFVATDGIRSALWRVHDQPDGVNFLDAVIIVTGKFRFPL